MRKGDDNVGAFAFEVWTSALNLQGNTEDAFNIASIAAHLAIFGDNPSAIARAMKRSRPFVYERLAAAKRIFRPLLDP